MGKASFIHIQDMGGKIQVYLKSDILPENIYDEVVRNLDLGDIVGCSGKIFSTKSEELSIKADDIQLLSKKEDIYTKSVEENINIQKQKQIALKNLSSIYDRI